MNKKIILVGMTLGSVIGAYVPMLFGVDAFSLIPILTSALGGILGIWLSHKLIR